MYLNVGLMNLSKHKRYKNHKKIIKLTVSIKILLNLFEIEYKNSI